MNSKNFSATVSAFFCMLALSGCMRAVGLPELDLEVQEKETQREQTNKTLKELGQPLIPKPDYSANPTDIHPIALLYEERPEGNPVELFHVGNDTAVINGGSSPVVTLKQSYYLTEITTYHWNNKAGAPAGTITLRGSDGKTYGPWTTSLENGVYWTAKPGVTLSAGDYTVIDSAPATWSRNTQGDGMGITWALGIPVK